MSYLPCELHCHTNHSDGDFSVKELQENAKNDHLVVIALTDHNTVSGYDEIESSIVPVIKGMELTTFYGHILALGLRKFVDPRDVTQQNIDEKIEELKEAGAVVGIAHPFQLGSPMCTGGRWEFDVKKWRNVDYIEIWHRYFHENNFENEQATKMWTDLLDRGYHIACTYGKDWHRIEDKSRHFGCTYLGITGEMNAENAVRALRMGKTIVSVGPKFFFRVHQKMNTYEIGETIKKGRTIFSFFSDLHARDKNIWDADVEYTTIKIITNGGECVLETRFDERHVQLSVKPKHWYRAELWGKVNDKKTPLAITSPIYCE